jgi:hypothetical protein
MFQGVLLFLLFIFFVLAVYMAAAQPVEGKDVVYHLFPQNGNYVESELWQLSNDKEI